jgi:hypothetical protein
MDTLPTYEDYLRKKGYVTTGLYVCPDCKQKQRAFVFVERTPGDWVCGSCYVPEIVAKELAEAPPLAPWETLEANHIRAIRTQLQERWRWAVMPDSPLNAGGQEKVMAFLKKLNTLTIDYATPDDVTMPSEPQLTGEDYATDA